jgi:hypothetical protein
MVLMMLIRSILLTFIFAALSTSVLEAQQKSSKDWPLPTLSICELVHNASRYDKKILRTSAIYETQYHGPFLYDPQCQTLDANINVEFVKSSRFRTAPQVQDELEEIMAQTREESVSRARVGLVGRFYDWNGIGYGHLNGSRFQIEVLSFEEAESVPADVPWSAEGDPIDSLQKEAKLLTEGINMNLNSAYLFDKAEELEKLLPADYTLTDEKGGVLNKAQVIERAFMRKKLTKGGAQIEMGSVRINGNTAVVTGRAAAGYCKVVVRAYRFTNKYEKRGGKWEIVRTRLGTVGPQWVKSDFPCH